MIFINCYLMLFSTMYNHLYCRQSFFSALYFCEINVVQLLQIWRTPLITWSWWENKQFIISGSPTLCFPQTATWTRLIVPTRMRKRLSWVSNVNRMEESRFVMLCWHQASKVPFVDQRYTVHVRLSFLGADYHLARI